MNEMVADAFDFESDTSEEASTDFIAVSSGNTSFDFT